MALATSTLLLLAGGLGAVSAISQGSAEASQARAEGKRADYQATVQRQQAERERQIAAGEEEDFRRRQSAVLAQKRAELGGAGVRSGTGTALLSAEDFSAEAELQALRIRSGGETRSTRLEQEAQLSDFSGRNARARGRSAKTQSYFRAGSSLLSGYTKAFG